MEKENKSALTVTDYCDVQERTKELGLNPPIALAFLPRNFDTAVAMDELVHESSVATIRSLFRQNKVIETRIEKAGYRLPEIQENQLSLILPIIFVSSSLLSQNPELLTISLNIIANYATNFFKGLSGRNNVKLSIVVEGPEGGRSKRIEYDGPPEGLKNIENVAKQVFR